MKLKKKLLVFNFLSEEGSQIYIIYTFPLQFLGTAVLIFVKTDW